MKLYWLLFSLLIFSSFGLAQHIELTTGIGHSFQNRTSIYGGNAKISDGTIYSFGASVVFDDEFSVDGFYHFQELTGEARSQFLNIDFKERVHLHYFLFGASRIFELTDKLHYNGGLKFGWLNLSSPEGNFSKRTLFASGINTGLKYYLNDFIAIRAQLQLLMPITNVGAALWWSPGQGTSVGVESSVPIVQLGGLIGLTFRIPRY